MKIAYISQSRLPSRAANSVHVMKMCSALSRQGHRVVLWGLRPKGDCSFRRSTVYRDYGVEPSFSMYRLIHFRGAYWTYTLRVVIATWIWRPKIVYSRCVHGARLAALLGLPVYFEVHHPLDGVPALDRAFRRLIASPNLKRLIFITKALDSYYQDRYPNIRCPTIVAPDGADVVTIEKDCPALRPDLKEKSGRLQVGYVGQLYPGKGMEVVKPLAEECPWADFHVVGGEENAVTEWVRNCRAIPNLFFKGFVPHREVPAVVAQFDVVLLPNQQTVSVAGNGALDISAWTSPLKAFEYMAAGKAILCSDLPVLKEVFEDGFNCLLCDPVDIQQWRGALLRLRDDAELRKSLGENAKNDFLTNYSWSARATTIVGT